MSSESPVPSSSVPSGPSARSAGRFTSTSWSLIVRATGGHSAQSRQALETLCGIYWYPIYAYVRRRGHDANGAEDLTQAYFVHLLEKERLQLADPQRGRFRTFLLTTLENFLRNEWRADQAIKRGGGQAILTIDYPEGERRYQNEPYHELTAEKIFDRSWLMTLLANTLEQLEQFYRERGKESLFGLLKPALSGEPDRPYHELAAELQMSEGAVKVAVHRMRSRWKELLRQQIADTVEDPQEVDAEIQELFRIMQ